MRLNPAFFLAFGLSATLIACQSSPAITNAEPEDTAEPAALVWPTARSPVTTDPKMEARIQQLIASMSLQQKVAQMIQADIDSVSEADIREFRIGAVLNGGGQTPHNKATAKPQEWVQLADRLFQASIAPAPNKIPIPLMWGVDAVHGHGNLMGATLYPHNIALGATRNPDLVRTIASATALEVAATGLDWNFAPSVAVARDIRWGRTYESFSEDPQLVAQMGAAAVEGLQGTANSAAFLDHNHVLASAKHFIGDGGTLFGDDQGVTQGDEAELIRLHLPGYLAAIEAGVQTVMASYSWWDGAHSHANKRLLTDLLKEHLGFDGVVVSDWQAIGHIHGCSIDNCAAAINAGVDLFMIPKAPDWKNFYRNTLGQVWNGTIPLERINDAVTRILRVKMRAGLWEKPRPAERITAQQTDLIGNPRHRDLARQAVRESLVLLKNNGILPLDPRLTLLVTGHAANSMSHQAGGWSVTWQGRDNPNSNYPGATTIYAALERATRAAGGRAILAEDSQASAEIDAAVVVFGEEPYAEMLGDLENLATLEFEQNNKRSLALLQALKRQGIPTVAVFLSGRPLWVNKELNVADAFVAAWQPGTEGAGVADVLLRDAQGNITHDFRGTLSFSWPAEVCDAAMNLDDADYRPLFPYGFGLTYQDPPSKWQPLSEDTSEWPHGCRLGKTLPAAETIAFTADQGWQFYLEKPTLDRRVVKPGGTTGFGSLSARRDRSRSEGVEARWDGSVTSRLILRNQGRQHDLLGLYAHHGALVFDIKMTRKPSQRMDAVLYSGPLGGSTLDLTPTLQNLPLNQWQEISVDLQCFENDRADFSKVDGPFGLQTAGTFAASISNVRYEPGRGPSATLHCAPQ